MPKHAIQNHFEINSKKLLNYFESNQEKWIKEYLSEKKNIDHDEPWLTLAALYAVFGEKTKYENKSISAFNVILDNVGLRNPLKLNEVSKVRVEVILPEISKYREQLQLHLKDGMIHFYPDRIKELKVRINKNIENKKTSLEGSTNLDTLIRGNRNGKEVAIFIEAKFLSDISKDISYNPVRDQIARNIDAGIDYCEKNKIELSDFYFLLLTPEVFRPIEFGGHPIHVLDNFAADKSRLYCYKMIEYLEPHNLKKSLPHREFNDLVIVSKNIGWITHESMINAAINFNTIDLSEVELIKKFFIDRNLLK